MAQGPLITRDEDILGGIPVFAGTRVPVQTLMEYLEKGYSLDAFLDDFPSVPRSKAQQVASQGGIGPGSLLRIAAPSATGE
jgi:uncharacterized protein (DUF433 family)